MSILSRSAPVFLILASMAPMPGQVPHEWRTSNTVYDASNNPLPSNPFRTQDAFMGPASMGTVSVRELERPLEGKGLTLLLKAKEFIAKGDVAHGLEKARAAAQYPAAEPYALGILATEHLREGQIDAAVVEFQQAAMLLPGKVELHSNLAFALGVVGRNEEALKEARMALKLDPGRAKVRFVLGQILLQMGREEEAKFHLKKAAVDIAGARKMLTQYFGE